VEGSVTKVEGLMILEAARDSLALRLRFRW